jgi:hypothetical protein
MTSTARSSLRSNIRPSGRSIGATAPAISEVVNSEHSWQQRRFHPPNRDEASHNANFPTVV